MSQIPRVVGAAEAAAILGVEVQRISRLRKTGRMPPTIADLAATPVWLRKHVESIRSGATTMGWDGQVPFARDPLVGVAEVAEILDIDKSLISRWRKAGRFPEPDIDYLSATPLWLKSTILAFDDQRARAARAAGKPESDPPENGLEITGE